MGKIQDLYETRIRPMVPTERLQLARLILDDLAPAEVGVDLGDQRCVDSPDDVPAHIRSPRLAHPEQLQSFAKQVVDLAAVET